MLKSLLLACLFFGLISMIVPYGAKSEWVYFLLICVLFVSVAANLSGVRFSFPEVSQIPVEETLAPQTAMLRTTVSEEVIRLTGSPPARVDIDLEADDGTYVLNTVYVVISAGDEREVEYALRQTFSFQGIFVLREET